MTVAAQVRTQFDVVEAIALEPLTIQQGIEETKRGLAGQIR